MEREKISPKSGLKSGREVGSLWMSDVVPVRGNISCQNGNMSTAAETAHSQLQPGAICGKIDIHIKVLAIEVYGNKSV